MAIALIARGVRDGPALRETSVALLPRRESVQRTGPRQVRDLQNCFISLHFLRAVRPFLAQALVYNSCAKTSVVTNPSRFRVNLIPMSGGAKL